VELKYAFLKDWYNRFVLHFYLFHGIKIYYYLKYYSVQLFSFFLTLSSPRSWFMMSDIFIVIDIEILNHRKDFDWKEVIYEHFHEILVINSAILRRQIKYNRDFTFYLIEILFLTQKKTSKCDYIRKKISLYFIAGHISNLSLCKPWKNTES